MHRIHIVARNHFYDTKIVLDCCVEHLSSIMLLYRGFEDIEVICAETGRVLITRYLDTEAFHLFETPTNTLMAFMPHVLDVGHRND